MLDRTRSAPFAAAEIDAAPRKAMRSADLKYGAAATRHGRRLSELLSGSPAWTLFERSRPRNSRTPHVLDITRYGPLLQIMRESGELDVRERLLDDRDKALVEVWSSHNLSELEREQQAHQANSDFFVQSSRLTAEYRPYYQKLRRALGSIAPLAAPRIRARLLLQPPAMALLFGACHADRSSFEPVFEDSCAKYAFRQRDQLLSVNASDLTPSPAVSYAPALAYSVASCMVPSALDQLDEMTWDVAAIAVSAFFVRTSGSDPMESFPILIDDYFDWRGVDPRKRTMDLRAQIEARIRLLCSSSLELDTEAILWLAGGAGGRRVKTPVRTRGSFLNRVSAMYRPTVWQSEAENEPLYGHLISLGTWAHELVRQRAMIGVFPKRLAEYDLRRQQWERRIGWYLTFQLHNQGSKMKMEVETVNREATARLKPQHPIKMRTVLCNSQVRWEEMARTNPGKVIKQWCDALENLKSDGLIGPYSCLDGRIDGSDLPSRSRLAGMLDWRFEFMPGEELAKHIYKHAPSRAKLGRPLAYKL